MERKLVLDVRNIPPQERYVNILDAFKDLNEGETLELVNDHDPRILWQEITMKTSDMFKWTYVEHGPFKWKVDITKLQSLNIYSSYKNKLNNNPFIH